MNELTIFNGETKNFCSTECVKTEELIDAFRIFVQKKIDKYQYTSKSELIEVFCPDIKRKISKELIFEILDRKYFDSDSKGFIYPKGKKINIPRK